MRPFAADAHRTCLLTTIGCSITRATRLIPIVRAGSRIALFALGGGVITADAIKDSLIRQPDHERKPGVSRRSPGAFPEDVTTVRAVFDIGNLLAGRDQGRLVRGARVVTIASASRPWPERRIVSRIVLGRQGISLSHAHHRDGCFDD